MVLNLFITYLGVDDLPEQAQRLVLKLVFIFALLTLAWFLSSSFYVLFVIDTVGIGQLGVLLAVSFLLQAVLDYPSGVLGDWVGQRWILFIGLFLEAVAYGFLIFADSFPSLLVVFIIRAIAYSQQSGAIFTWFENNYKIAANESDPQRSIFKFFLGRLNTIIFIAPGIAVVVGGMLATVYSRKTVFFFQVISLTLMAFILLIVITDFSEIERPKRSVRNYFKLLGEGLRFGLFNRVMFLLLVGMTIVNAASTLFMEILLFPMLYGYTGSDAGAGVLRFVLLIIGTIATFYAGKVGQKIDSIRIPWFLLFDIVVYFGTTVLLTMLFPIERNIFTPIAVVALIIMYIFHWFLVGVFNILLQSIFLDLIPDRNRNSIYSLIPTLILIVCAPGSILGAWLFENVGVPATLALLGLFELLSVLFFHLSIKLGRKKDLKVSAAPLASP
ncbi:MAG: MFS transporter [Candidatus Hodarchaeales archaeon]